MTATWNVPCPSRPDELPSAQSEIELALDAAGLGYWDLDVATGWARCSARAQQIFGYPEPLTRWALDSAVARFVTQDRQEVVDAFARVASTGSIQFEKRICRANDNETRWISVKGCFDAAHGAGGRVVGVVDDVTERRLIDDQWRHAEKMEAMRDFSGRIAHDFNNLLMVISGNLEMLSARAPQDEKSRRSFMAARQGVERGARLSEQLLAVSTRAQQRLQAVPIRELIGSVASRLARAAGDAVSLDVRHGPERWLCSADPQQLGLALVNLATNAGEAMPFGGILTVSTGILELDERLARSLGSRSRNFVVVCVEDTGTGIDPKLIPRVAEPLFTTKPGHEGAGLGLSQVYGFAAQSGGFVTIESEPGVGTTVRLHLPRVVQG